MLKGKRNPSLFRMKKMQRSEGKAEGSVGRETKGWSLDEGMEGEEKIR